MKDLKKKKAKDEFKGKVSKIKITKSNREKSSSNRWKKNQVLDHVRYYILI